MMRVIRPRFVRAVVVAGSALLAGAAFAQAPGRARLLVTVMDPSGLVVNGAAVAVVPVDGASAPPRTRQTSGRGLAEVDDLLPGRYRIEAELAGFEKGALADVRLRPGDNRHVIVLPLQRVQNEITVARDAQAAAADPRARFGAVLTASEIELLSDDPAEMAQQLREMAGPTAILRVDSFEGSPLPPKAQIKSIRITRDAFAAENHFAGHPFVDVITQPGVGPLKGSGNYRLRDGSLSARSPLTPTRGDERTQAYGMTVGGSLLRNRSSFSLSVNGQNAYDTPTVFVALPGGGRRSEVLDIRRPTENITVTGLLDYTLTRDQVLRFTVQRRTAASRNLGVGLQDVEERAYSTDTSETLVRIQETGPIGRRSFINTRMQLGQSGSDSRSAVDAMTYQIAGARTAGGAQIAGGRETTAFVGQSDLDYVRGIHTVRTGISLEAMRYRSTDSTNYLGTYFFESLDAFERGQPRSFRRRIGDPDLSYSYLQAGVYVQDDLRVRKGLTLSAGLRYELQSHVADVVNLGPRLGLSWAPFKSGKTTIRSSWGIFYDWLGNGTYEQALRVDGFRQREIDIAFPSFPEPGVVGIVTPANRYLLAGDLPMPRQTRISTAVDQTLTPTVRVTVSYAHQRGSGLLRGRNLNAPVGGIRPDSAFANVVEATGDAALRQRVLNVTTAVTLAAPSPALNRRRIEWRRTAVNLTYSTGKVENNTDGAFNLPASGRPAGEWAQVPAEIRPYRLNIGVTTQVVRNLGIGVILNAFTGTPYTITTGRDDNSDLVYNDRPAGVGRNTAWTPDFRTLNGTLSYAFTVGGGGRSGGPIAPGRDGLAAGDTGRYRLVLTASVNNLTNRANYGNYSGVMTSPFFRTPTAVINPRKVDIGISFAF